jgi:hypothetical protein
MQPTRTITHPNLPGVSVNVHKLTRVERFAVMDEQEGARRPVAITGPDGLPLFDKATGQPFFTFQQHGGSLLQGAATPKRSITGWSGVTDENGNPVSWKPDLDTVLILWDDRYDVKSEECLFCDEPKSAHVEIKEGDERPDGWHPPVKVLAFGAYINRKVSDPKYFDSDPSGEVSLSS